MTTPPAGRSSDEIQRALPLKAVDFAILLVLSDEDLHGYGIVKRVAENAVGGVRLAPGNLYQVLDRLLRRRWIEKGTSRAPRAAARRRRYYRITSTGRRIAAAEASRLSAMMPTAERLGLIQQG